MNTFGEHFTFERANTVQWSITCKHCGEQRTVFADFPTTIAMLNHIATHTKKPK